MPAPRCSCFCCLSAVAPARVGRHASFVWHVGAWQHKCVCAAVAARHGDGTCAPAPTGTRLTRDHARAIHALDSPPGEAHRQSTCSHTRAPHCICSDVQHQPARIERDDRERDEPEDDHRTDEQKRERDGGRDKTGRREERGQYYCAHRFSGGECMGAMLDTSAPDCEVLRPVRRLLTRGCEWDSVFVAHPRPAQTRA